MHLQGAGVWDRKTARLCAPLRLPLHIPSSHWMSLWQVWQRQHRLHCARPGTQLLLLWWNERIKKNGHFSLPTLVLKDHHIQNVCVCSVLGLQTTGLGTIIPTGVTVLTGKRSELRAGSTGARTLPPLIPLSICWLPTFFSLSMHSFVRAFLFHCLRGHLGQSLPFRQRDAWAHRDGGKVEVCERTKSSTGFSRSSETAEWSQA